MDHRQFERAKARDDDFKLNEYLDSLDQDDEEDEDGN